MPKRKQNAGRPKRQRPSEVMLKIMRRSFEASLTDPARLLFMRSIVRDDRLLAEFADAQLTAMFKDRGIECSRERRIRAIASWLQIDAGTLTTWFAHKRR